MSMALLALGPQLVAAGSADSRDVTFTRDIAPIIFNHCAECHRTGGAGPFELLTYDDVRKRARQIAIVTAERYMPPWLPAANENSLRFAGERRLDERQIKTIQAWVDQDFPQGDPNDLPAPPQSPDVWPL